MKQHENIASSQLSASLNHVGKLNYAMYRFFKGKLFVTNESGRAKFNIIRDYEKYLNPQPDFPVEPLRLSNKNLYAIPATISTLGAAVSGLFAPWLIVPTIATSIVSSYAAYNAIKIATKLATTTKRALMLYIRDHDDDNDSNDRNAFVGDTNLIEESRRLLKIELGIGLDGNHFITRAIRWLEPSTLNQSEFATLLLAQDLAKLKKLESYDIFEQLHSSKNDTIKLMSLIGQISLLDEMKSWDPIKDVLINEDDRASKFNHAMRTLNTEYKDTLNCYFDDDSQSWELMYYSVNYHGQEKKMPNPFAGLAEGFSKMGNLFEAMQGMFGRKREYNPYDVTPKLENVEVYESLERDVIFNFNYERSGHNFSFELPVFSNLPKYGMYEDLLEGEKQNIETEYSKENKRMKKKLFAIYNPLVMAAVGAISAFAFSSNIMLPLKIILLSSSLSYFVPPIIYYVCKNYYKSKLIKIFDEYANEELRKDHEYGFDRIYKLSVPYKILLHPLFPDNDDLLCSYYYLNGLARERVGHEDEIEWYEKALEVAPSVDRKQVIVRALLNKYHNDLDWATYNSYVSCACYIDPEKYDKLCQRRDYLLGKAEGYLKHVSFGSGLHKQLGNMLHKQLDDCLDSLRKKDFDAAAEKFYKIKLEGYSRQAHWSSAAMYYQIEAIIALIKKKIITPEEQTFDEWESLHYASYTVDSVKFYINNFFPDKSEEYKAYYDAFYTTSKDIDNAHKKPSPKPIVPMSKTKKKKPKFDDLKIEPINIRSNEILKFKI